MKQPNETQLPPERMIEMGMPKDVTKPNTFDLIQKLKQFDKAFASAYGPRRRQLDCYMDQIESELLRRAGLVMNGLTH